LASKLGAEVVEIPLRKIIKEVYIKDEGVIVIDPNSHPYKKRHLIAHGLAHHLFHRNTRVNYFLDERDNRFNYWKQRKQEKEAEVFAVFAISLPLTPRSKAKPALSTIRSENRTTAFLFSQIAAINCVITFTYANNLIFSLKSFLRLGIPRLALVLYPGIL
jgi:Zn-dependent peptidase ImmA (M78 family)